MPAIMSTRIIKDSKERELSIMLTPFIPCSAKLPIIAMFTGYFFAQIAMGNTVEKSLKIASVASAIAVSRKGASVSIPMLNEVLAAENSFQSS